MTGRSGRGRRVAAAARHLLLDALRGHRVLVPMAVYLVVMGVVVIDDHAAAPGPWVAGALLLYPTAAWVAVSLAGAEPPARRAVTTAAVGGPGRVVVALGAASLLLDLVLALAAVLLPAAVAPTVFPLATVPAVLAAHLVPAAAGTALGLVLGPPVVSRAGWSFGLTALVVAVTLPARWLPPVASTGAALAAAHPVTTLLGDGGFLRDAVVSLALLVLAGGVQRRAAGT